MIQLILNAIRYEVSPLLSSIMTLVVGTLLSPLQKIFFDFIHNLWSNSFSLFPLFILNLRAVKRESLFSKVFLFKSVFLVISLFSATSQAAKVDGIRLWRAPDNTRLVFDLDSPVEHKVFNLTSPDRLVIDIGDSSLNANLDALAFADTPIKKLRHGKRKGGDLRFVLDLSASVKPRSFVLKKHGGKPDRLVIDLYDQTNAVKNTVKKTIEPVESEKRDIIVAIDPGHGGEDPGAIGPRRLFEKGVVLKVSQELARLINAEPGYKALLVRTGDYYLPHEQRREKARKARADIFISVHADGFDDPRANGASVFALSQRGATSQTARILASRANESDLIGGAGSVSLKDKGDLLAGVLVDLSMTANLANSLDVGKRVLERMGKITKLHSRQVEQAGFLVLKSPDVPSILVETGFITNPNEAKKLNTSSHRRKLANSIFQGVKSYFQDKPPEGSLVAWHKQKGLGPRRDITHTIARGDTLSGIAQKYRVSVAKIKAANKLSSPTIRIGQKLTIPTS